MRLPDAASDGPQLRGFGVEIIATLKSGFVERIIRGEVLS